ncbi:putative Non-specific protein-tyrosine kinase [Gigaspora margarita]|uniref:Putative Non-specific protein-tyrosine kinase n=1 Tax=Gigaspora margarita TaxID=4874 RepID=A0A8H4A2A4_GIGMA|nr:putative Non-specific protein-tyrosine kinase [Gigaspora margarita]
MESDPNKRPTATNICHRVGYWLEEMEQDDDNETKKQFSEADNIKPKLKSPIHSNDMYTSKSINTKKITEELNQELKK